MSEESFLRLSRRFFANPFWEEARSYSRAEAWLDLLNSAAWEDHRRVVSGRIVQVKRGGIVASARYLSERWGWSKTKVTAFLELLEKEEMIAIEKSRKNTTIFLCKFDRYNPQKDQSKTTERPLKDHSEDEKKTTERPPNSSVTHNGSDEKKTTEKPQANSEMVEKKTKVLEEGERGGEETGTPRASADQPPGWEPPLPIFVAACERYSIPAWYAEKKWEVQSAKGWCIGRTPVLWKKFLPLVRRDFVNDGSPSSNPGAVQACLAPKSPKALVYQGDSDI